MARKKRMTPEQRERAENQYEYDRSHTTQISLKFNNRTDKDIVSWINNIRNNWRGNVQGEIKRLIRSELDQKKS